ncbi:hypothetical protein HanOQP8_Chr06g0224351 [Helianthus annuus]|nr:hypothetical protein HanOQP8_Chr06g0224351 [Helianthus annuus]
MKRGGSWESGGSESGAETRLEYFGWVYHLGTNSIGREFCHLRFLYIRGKYVMMYKRDPHENPGIVCLLAFIIHTLFSSFILYYINTCIMINILNKV